MIRVLEKILGSFCIFFGGAGGGMICFVPQMGQTSTPSRSSVPQVGQIMISSPWYRYLPMFMIEIFGISVKLN